MQQALMVLGFHDSAIRRSPSPRPSPPGRGRSERALRNGSPFGDSSQHLESESTLLGERFPGNDNSRVEIPEPMENIERPTSNLERRSERGFALSFDVRRWMFDVGCSSGFMERAGVRASASFISQASSRPPTTVRRVLAEATVSFPRRPWRISDRWQDW